MTGTSPAGSHPEAPPRRPRPRAPLGASAGSRQTRPSGGARRSSGVRDRRRGAGRSRRHTTSRPRSRKATVTSGAARRSAASRGGTAAADERQRALQIEGLPIRVSRATSKTNVSTPAASSGSSSCGMPVRCRPGTAPRRRSASRAGVHSPPPRRLRRPPATAHAKTRVPASRSGSERGPGQAVTLSDWQATQGAAAARLRRLDAGRPPAGAQAPARQPEQEKVGVY